MTKSEPVLPPPNPDQPEGLDRLTTVLSPVDVVGRYVADMAPIPAEELAEWLAGLPVPVGWQVIQSDASLVAHGRVMVSGARPGGGWDACDTLSVFGFTGAPPRDVVEENADCTLRDLDAAGICTVVAPPPPPGVAAVRSSGYFGIEGRQLWARFETYVAGSDQPGQGRLIQHNILVDGDSLMSLGQEVGELTDSAHQAFLTSIGAASEKRKWLTPTTAGYRPPVRMSGPSSDELVAIDLTDDERSFMYFALIHWGALASDAPLPINALFGIGDWKEFDSLTERLAQAIKDQQPLSDLDWALAVFLTELSFGSDLVGAGVEFALVSHSDEIGIRLLRAIQRKISSRYLADLLFPNAGRPRKSFDYDAWKQKSKQSG
jgi:hypothetical protein